MKSDNVYAGGLNGVSIYCQKNHFQGYTAREIMRKVSAIHRISRIDLLGMGVPAKINNRCNVT